MTASGDDDAEPRVEGSVLRVIVRPVKLVVTALAIVGALALGIPWLIERVW